jgi:hypothetical protein
MATVWHRCIDTPPPTDRVYRTTDGKKLYLINPVYMLQSGDAFWTEHDRWAEGWTDDDG